MFLPPPARPKIQSWFWFGAMDGERAETLGLLEALWGRSCVHLSGHHNWTKIIFRKPWFGHVFEPFVVPKWPIFKALSALRGAKNVQHGLRNGGFHLFVHPKWSKSIFGKTHYWPLFTNFWSQKKLFSRHFVTWKGPKWLAMGSKRAHFTCLCTANGLGSFLEKDIFDPFLTDLLVPNQPIFKAFCDFGGAKMACNGLKRGSFH